MARFRRFEDIPVWQAGRELVKGVYGVTRTAPCCCDSGFCDQAQRAAVSITSNVAEGHERGTTPDLIVFLYYAKGSAGEVRSLLYNAEDLGYLDAAEAATLRGQAEDISRQIYAWVTSMQAPDFARGPAFHKSRPLAETKWEEIMEQFGIVRLANGRCVQATDLADDPQHPGEEPK